MADVNDSKKFDDLASLADAYEAFAALVAADDPHAPSYVLLHNLNGQLRTLCDRFDEQALMS